MFEFGESTFTEYKKEENKMSFYNFFLKIILKNGIFKYFFVFFIPFLFSSCSGKNQKPEDKESNKIVDCKSIDILGIYGNKTCTQMYCRILKAECTYKNGEKKTPSLVCLALKNPTGDYSCPKAYDCAVSKTPEYDEYIKTLPKGVSNKITFFNSKCDGAKQF